MRKKVLIIDSNYPNENNLYGDVFVHSRARFYKNVFDIQVLGWDKRRENFEFTYEGIPAKSFKTKNELTRNIFEYKPDIILIHFVEGWMLSAFIKSINCPVLIWVHGAEALGWYRRIFNFRNVLQFGNYVLKNTLQLIKVRQLISYSNHTDKVAFIFVSNWMKGITETDTQIKVKNYHLIPNPIDAKIFQFVEKTPNQRKHILLIRSFDSKKYANDIAIDAIMELSNKDFFSDLRFSIYGMGKYFKPLTKKLEKFENVTLHNTFVENKSIPGIHKQHGIFLCPTRQDAQGVSMCEAMSSGLVPISSFNTAIPEFLDDQKTGFMTNSAKEIAQAVELLYYNPDKYLKISKNASTSIQEKSGNDTVLQKEIKIIEDNIDQYIKP